MCCQAGHATEETEPSDERERTDPREAGDILMGMLALDADQ
jgi:hypothetical protein